MEEQIKSLDRKNFIYIPISAIDKSKSLVRTFFDEEKLKETAASIEEKGILQPILIRPQKDNPNQFEVIMGMRRLRGALLAGIKEMPCIIENTDDKESLELALTENMQREDLTPFEEALGIMKLIREFNYSIAQVCRKLGKSNGLVVSRIKLLSLPEEVQKNVAQGRLSVKQATAFVGLNEERQKTLMREIVFQPLNSNRVKDFVLEATIEKSLVKKSKEKKFSLNINPQIERFKKLLAELNVDGIPFSKRGEMKRALNRLKELIDEVIQNISDAT